MALLTGARLFIYVDNRRIVTATGFSIENMGGYAEERQIDSDESVEFAPTSVGVGGIIRLVRDIGEGGAQGLGLMLPPPYFVRKKYSSMRIIERQTGLAMFDFEGEVIFDQEKWETVSKSLMMGSVSYKAVKYANEATGSLANAAF